MKPDWARKQVENVAVPYRDPSGATYVFLRDEKFVRLETAINLLRAERRRPRRIIQQFRSELVNRQPHRLSARDYKCMIFALDELRRRLR